MLIGAHSVLLVSSQAGEVTRAAASASAAVTKESVKNHSDILDVNCALSGCKGERSRP